MYNTTILIGLCQFSHGMGGWENKILLKFRFQIKIKIFSSEKNVANRLGPRYLKQFTRYIENLGQAQNIKQISIENLTLTMGDSLVIIIISCPAGKITQGERKPSGSSLHPMTLHPCTTLYSGCIVHVRMTQHSIMVRSGV